MFFLNRLVVELLSPLTFSLILFLFSLSFFLFHKRVLGIVCQASGLTILIILGYGIITKDQLIELEARYQPFEMSEISSEVKEKIKYVVVLGSGHVSDPRLPVTSQIGSSSLYRLVEGIRIVNKLPRARLIISGGIAYDPVPNADVVAEVATILGQNRNSLIVENKPRDTIEESQFLKKYIQTDLFVLVTSASHMSRAMDLFLQNGMYPIAAPTNYILKKHINPPAGGFFPSLGNLSISKMILYEWIGTLWQKVKQITGNSP